LVTPLGDFVPHTSYWGFASDPVLQTLYRGSTPGFHWGDFRSPDPPSFLCPPNNPVRSTPLRHIEISGVSQAVVCNKSQNLYMHNNLAKKGTLRGKKYPTFGDFLTSTGLKTVQLYIWICKCTMGLSWRLCTDFGVCSSSRFLFRIRTDTHKLTCATLSLTTTRR